MGDYKENPLVSIVMPVYNADNYLEEAVDSILTQTYSHFEFIIIDDGSTDRTAEMLNHLTDLRIKLITNEKNEGNYLARNKGCRLAKGKYIAVMDADDIAVPERLAIQVAYMEKNSDVQLCGGAYKLIGKNVTIVEPVKYEEIRYVLLKTFCMLHPTIMFRKKLMEKLGYYSVDSLYAEDYNLVMRFALQGVVTNLHETLLMRRQHREQISTAHSYEQNRYSCKVQLHYQHEMEIYFPSLDKVKFLSHLAIYIRSTISYVKQGGLYYGRMGIIIFLYHYASYSKNDDYHNLADRMLKGLWSNLRQDIPIDLAYGLCGIGIGVGYLLHNNFIEGDLDELFSEIDQLIMEKTDFETDDWSLESGIIGIMYYVVYRLSTTKQTHLNLFKSQFISHLISIADKLQNHKNWICPCSDILSSYKKCIEGELYIIDWKDFVRRTIGALPIYQAIGKWNLGMNNGAAGWGINFMLNLNI